MFDKDHAGVGSRTVYLGTLYTGVGLEINANIEDVGRLLTQGLSSITRELSTSGLAGGRLSLVVSEASLDELAGKSASANLSLIGSVSADINLVPVGSGACNLVSASGGLDFSIGASLRLNATDVIYDSQRGWCPNSA